MTSASVPPSAAAARAVCLSALVPVYNEIETIEEIVRRIEQISVVGQIVVVDDKSVDGTQAVVRRLADEGRIDADFHAVNRGKGAALRSALALVRQDYLVIQDADLEYDPRDLYAMAQVVERTGARVVYGSRFMGGQRTGMKLTHYVGNRLLTLLLNVLFRQRLTDMETCYKLFSTPLLRQLGIDNDRFDMDPEITAKVFRSGHTIREVPVSYVGRPYIAGKKIKPWDGLSAMRTLWRYRNWRLPGE